MKQVELQYRDVTFDLFDKVCVLLSLDPDDVLDGKISFESAVFPGLQTATLLLELVLTKGVDLTTYERPAQEELLGLALADFFFECIKVFEEQRFAARTTHGGPESKGSKYLMARARQSRARSAA